MVGGVSMLRQFIYNLRNTKKSTERAWVEINIEHLNQNYVRLKNKLAAGCEIMAVLKADAYGNGDLIMAKELSRLGVRAFAVETVDEGITLRKNKIKGEILIFSETPETQIVALSKYGLTQSVASLEYAKLLNSTRKHISIHINLTAEMEHLQGNRIGVEEVKKIYQQEYTRVTGIYAKLTNEASTQLEDIILTEMEIEAFYSIITYLNGAGIAVGKTHLQSSYGILHYPHIKCDYARVGSALYGLCDGEGQFKPVLSMRARVLMTKQLSDGECYYYGDCYIANREMNVAVISIGSADGIPKGLSSGDGYLILHGERVPVIGQVCMNQLLVDISQLEQVAPGDIATVVGSEGELTIYLNDIAMESGNIADEVLDRFLKCFNQGIIYVK